MGIVLHKSLKECKCIRAVETDHTEIEVCGFVSTTVYHAIDQIWVSYVRALYC